MSKHFTPADLLNELKDVATWSASKLGDGPWAGTAVTRDGRQLELEQLASSWKVTDVTAESGGQAAISASSLEAALKKAGIQ